MPLIIVGIGVALLLLLMIGFKLNGFVTLIIVSLVVGLAEGMPITKILGSIQSGVGGTLGSLALVIGFGSILGRLMENSGGAQRIATTLINKFGKKYIQWAVVTTGFVVGIALFYEIGVVLLIPLVFTIAVAAEVPLLYVGIPMVAALSVTHGFLPPHPGATAIAVIYKADMGLTLLYGILIAIPTVIVAGPVFARFVKINHGVPEHLFEKKSFKDEEMPGFGVSVFTALIPVFLMAAATIAKLTLPAKSQIVVFLTFIGDPIMALLIAVIVAIFTFGVNRGKKMAEIAKISEGALTSIAIILLVIAGGGAFKQVLIDSGVGKYVAHLVQGSNMSPIFLAWLIAACLRIAQGSATIAAITAAGIVMPVIQATHARPELMVLATGAGSLIFSHVNDPGFWMFKEFFNLSIPETLSSWSVLETIISVMGLIGALGLSAILH